MKIARSFVLGFLGVVAAVAFAAQPTFNLYSPATGIQKNTGATYANTAAASSDVRALWSGTCDSTTYLRGDGSCQAPPGTGGGTVNSVGLSAPSVFGVSGSPVTTSGTLALSFATGQTANRVLASPDGTTGAVALRALVAADLPAVPLATGVSGTLPVANGGTGVTALGALTRTNDTNVTLTLGGSASTALVNAASITAGWTGQLAVTRGGTGAATLSGLLKGNGTSAIGAAANTDVIGLWAGSCNSGTFLRGDGICAGVTATPGGSSTQVQYNNGGAFAGDAAMTWNSGTGTLAATNFSGNGSLLTALNGSQVTTGTVADARLSSNVPLKNTANTFTATQSITGAAATTLPAWVVSGTTTAASYGRFQNTGGDALFGVESSIGGSLITGASAYDTVIRSQTGGISFSTDGGSTLFARIGAGMVLGSPSGGDKGFGTFNAASTIYQNNVAVATLAGNNFFGTQTVLGGGIVAGAPTGGDKGAGTINAGSIYQNNVAVATVGGSNNQVQYNSGGVLAGSSGFTFNGTSLTVNGSGITALDASNISSGTVNNSRLPSTINVATDVQVGGVSVCRSNGTNCPSTGTIASGTFTPGITLSNGSSATNYRATYQRVGSIVNGAFLIGWTVAGSGVTTGSITLPVASNFSSAIDATGSCNVINNAGNTVIGSRLYSDDSNDRMTVIFSWGSSETVSVQCSYSYVLL